MKKLYLDLFHDGRVPNQDEKVITNSISSILCRSSQRIAIG
jgi:hypothetical protein